MLEVRKVKGPWDIAARLDDARKAAVLAVTRNAPRSECVRLNASLAKRCAKSALCILSRATESMGPRGLSATLRRHLGRIQKAASGRVSALRFCRRRIKRARLAISSNISSIYLPRGTCSEAQSSKAPRFEFSMKSSGGKSICQRQSESIWAPRTPASP